MIELRNLTKVFNLSGDSHDKKIALDNLNLTINDGEFVTVIGSNGSGKTTTMNIVAGSLQPDSGSVILSGMDITNMKEHVRAKYFGRVFQDPRMGTTAEMSVLENLEIAYRRGKLHSPIKWGFSNKIVVEFFKNNVKLFNLGLENRMQQKVGLLSGGQRQALTLLMAASDPRIDTRREFVKMNVDIAIGPKLVQYKNTLVKEEKKAIKEEIGFIKKNNSLKAGAFYDEKLALYEKSVKNAANMDEKVDALVNLSNSLHEYNQDRKILLLDEHTAALDPKTARKVLQLTNEIVRAKKLTTLMITHNMKDAITYGDRLIMFHGGKIIYDVSGEEKQKLKVDDLLKLFEKAEQLS